MKRVRFAGSRHFSAAAAILLGVLAASACVLRAEVFLLRPLGSRGDGGSRASALPLAAALPGLENASPLFREPLKVNGRSFTLELFRSSADFDEMRRFLRSRGVHFAESGDTLRCAAKLPDGSLERLLVVRSPGRGPATVFRIAGPPGIPPVPSWPQELPSLPPGVRPVQVIELLKSGSVYGIFENAGSDGRAAFRSVDSFLRARGWLPAGNEGSPLIGGSGDMYFNRREKRIVWVTFDDDGRGAFYSRFLNSRGGMPRSL